MTYCMSSQGIGGVISVEKRGQDNVRSPELHGLRFRLLNLCNLCNLWIDALGRAFPSKTGFSPPTLRWR